MGKNIVICCDGTSNDVTCDSTNVLRLYRSLERSPDKLAYYDAGVGTVSYLADETYVVEPGVQKPDFKDPTLTRVVGRKPLLPKRLREFKNFRCQFGGFVVRPVENIQLQLDSRDSIPQFRVLPGKGGFVDLVQYLHEQSTHYL